MIWETLRFAHLAPGLNVDDQLGVELKFLLGELGRDGAQLLGRPAP
jgi:hypothetical protein